MSKLRYVKVRCEHCGEEFEIPVYDSVNVSLDPELKEKAITGELFVYDCPHCKEINIFTYPVIYHDMDNKFMVLINDEKQIYEQKETVDAANKRLMEDFPGLPISKNYGVTFQDYGKLETLINSLENGYEYRLVLIDLYISFIMMKRELKNGDFNNMELLEARLIKKDGKLVKSYGVTVGAKEDAHESGFELEFTDKDYQIIQKMFNDKIKEYDDFMFTNENALEVIEGGK